MRGGAVAAQRAYAEEPAGAADKCPDLKELGKKSRPPGFSVRSLP